MSVETGLAASPPTEKEAATQHPACSRNARRKTGKGFNSQAVDMTQDLPGMSNSASSPKIPGPAGVHHPQISIGRTDHIKRPREISPLSPTVAPAVLHERQVFREVVTEAKHFVATLLPFTPLRNWHDASV